MDDVLANQIAELTKQVDSEQQQAANAERIQKYGADFEAWSKDYAWCLATFRKAQIDAEVPDDITHEMTRELAKRMHVNRFGRL